MSQRIYEEFKDLYNKPIENCGITVGLVNEGCYDDWKVTLKAPSDSQYKGGLFLLNIHFPPDFPTKPPEAFFITPIYHVNVKPTAKKEEGGESLGHVCISTLNWWKPNYSIREVLLNIFSLFYMHNPDSAYGIDRANEYKEEDGSVYFEKVKFFTKKYALPKYSNKNYDRNQDWDFSI